MRSADRVRQPVAFLAVFAVHASARLIDAQTAPRDYRAELEISTRPSDVAASPSGQIWLATVGGMLYTADSVNGDWREAGEASLDTMMTRLMGKPFRLGVGSIDGIAFADAQHGIAWGRLHADHRSTNPAQVYVTADGGLRWRLVEVGEAFSINDAHVRASGEILLAGYKGRGADRLTTVLFRSTDFGSTWTPWPAPPARSPVAAIAFDGPSNGVVAALNNELFMTGDGGRSWSPLPTPLYQRKYLREQTHDVFARITQVAFANGWLLIEQDGHTFRSRSAPVEWQPWTGEDLLFFDSDVETNRFCVVDARLRLVLLDSALAPAAMGKAPMIAPPIAGECRGGRLTAMDIEYRLYAVDTASARYGFPLTSSDSTRNVHMGRLAHGSLWGATEHFLYSSDDRGRTWFRLPCTASTVRGVLPRNDHVAFIWDGHGVNALFDRRTGVTTIVPSLVGYDVMNVVQAGGRWIAYGGRQYESAQRVEVAQSFIGGEFRGTRPDGFVVLSLDSGSTWTEVDRWTEGGVADLYVSPDARRMVLLSYLGSIRELIRRDDKYAATNLLIASSGNRDAVPYVQAPFAIYFDDARTGYVGGWIHHLPDRYFRTADGGKRWVRVEESDFPYRGMMPFDRRYLAWTKTGIAFLDGPRRDPVVDLSSFLRGRGTITGVSRVAASDSVLVDIYNLSGTFQVIVDTRAKTATPLRR